MAAFYTLVSLAIQATVMISIFLKVSSNPDSEKIPYPMDNLIFISKTLSMKVRTFLRVNFYNLWGMRGISRTVKGK